MFQGLRTAAYHVSNIDKARDWYSEVLGIKPYFDQPFYVGFNVGGFELGLQPQEEAPGTSEAAGKATGVVAYWGVEDIESCFKRLLELGGTKHQEPLDVGEGIIVASVLDPFGNIFGIIRNPNFSLSDARGQ
jgi:predicted enzyme related to lactoylglutathione lyase